jgi:hypothetical protein
MENILKLLFVKHKTWLNYVKSFGVKDGDAEDYVQEMYIKIDAYIKKFGNSIMYTENEINFYFVYITLRNLYIDDRRKLKNFVSVDLSDDFVSDDTEYQEGAFEVRNNALIKWRNNLDSKIKNIKGYNQEKAEYLYMKFLFDKVFIDGESVSELGRKVGISYWSLRNSILLIKNQIKNEI